MTHWMRPPELARVRERDHFDPVIEGAREGLSRELSLAIWERVCADAANSNGRVDADQTQRRFRELAARIAAHGGRLCSDVGRITRSQPEIVGTPRGPWAVDELSPRTPGKTTLVATEMPRRIVSGWLAPYLLPRDIAKPSAPGRQTLVGDEPSPRLGFEDYRVLGLKGVLQRLGPDHSLRADLIAAAAAADRSTAGRATLWREPLPSTTTPDGHALWHAAERHAATLYRRAVRNDVVDEHDPAVESALQQRGTGQPLPMELRRDMERAFDISLAGVRIHTDSIAAQAARVLGAEAFTVGEDIFFAEGKFAPDTQSGRRLLAHELTHVVQTLRGQAVPSNHGLQVSQPDEPLEREADAVAARIDTVRDDTGGSTPAVTAQPIGESSRSTVIAAPSRIFRQDADRPAPLVESPAMGLDIHQGGITASGIVQGHDASVRLSSYVKPAKDLAAQILKDVESGKISHLEGREAAAIGRNQLLEPTREKLSPGGRALSKALKEEGKNLPELIAKYSRELLKKSPKLMRQYGLETLDPKSPLFNAAKYEAAMADLVKSRAVSMMIIQAAGTPNKIITAVAKFSKVAGPVAAVAGVAMTGYKILSAPEGEKLRVASRETGGFTGGMLGSVGGSLAAAWTASLACGPGAVVCGLVITLVIVGAAAYGGSRLGEAGGMKMYDSISQGLDLMGDTPQLIETTTNMFGSPEARRHYYELREIETGEPPPWEVP